MPLTLSVVVAVSAHQALALTLLTFASRPHAPPQASLQVVICDRITLVQPSITALGGRLHAAALALCNVGGNEKN